MEKYLERIATALEQISASLSLKPETGVVAVKKKLPRKPTVSEPDRMKALVNKWIAFSNDADWVMEEYKKADLWVEANPRRKPKDTVKFMGNWLNRGWEKHRKTIPTHHAKSDFSFLKE